MLTISISKKITRGTRSSRQLRRGDIVPGDIVGAVTVAMGLPDVNKVPGKRLLTVALP